jgi:very-short-patch-repair endonuclease
MDYDQIRTQILYFKNILIVRFKNEEITNDLNTVIIKLKEVTNKRKQNLEKI